MAMHMRIITTKINLEPNDRLHCIHTFVLNVISA